jgi:putative SOS response-associated peptidase YedK
VPLLVKRAVRQEPERWWNWKDPASGEWIRTFAIITTDANELVADIHDRMPLILAPPTNVRWLSDEIRSERIDVAIPGRADADVADLNAHQQARERRSLDPIEPTTSAA